MRMTANAALRTLMHVLHTGLPSETAINARCLASMARAAHALKVGYVQPTVRSATNGLNVIHQCCVITTVDTRWMLSQPSIT